MDEGEYHVNLTGVVAEATGALGSRVPPRKRSLRRRWVVAGAVEDDDEDRRATIDDETASPSNTTLNLSPIYVATTIPSLPQRESWPPLRLFS